MHCIVVSEELLADTGAGAAHRHVVDGVEGFVALEGGLALLGTKKAALYFPPMVRYLFGKVTIRRMIVRQKGEVTRFQASNELSYSAEQYRNLLALNMVWWWHLEQV